LKGTSRRTAALVVGGLGYGAGLLGLVILVIWTDPQMSDRRIVPYLQVWMVMGVVAILGVPVAVLMLRRERPKDQAKSVLAVLYLLGSLFLGIGCATFAYLAFLLTFP
jgi:cytochrome bd-type quinol oxidase subunit 2